MPLYPLTFKTPLFTKLPVAFLTVKKLLFGFTGFFFMLEPFRSDGFSDFAISVDSEISEVVTSPNLKFDWMLG